jgi:phage antirepressor YoqD-like protein
MDISDMKQKYPLTIPINEAAKVMGISAQFLRAALLQDKFPFGVGVKMGQNEFYINTTRFIRYMEGL